MPFELWGATDTYGVSLPESWAGVTLLVLYFLVFFYLLYRRRHQLQFPSRRQWLGIVGLWLAAFLTSQLFSITFSPDRQLAPLQTARNPVVSLTLFTAVPFLLAGVIFNPAVALVAGLCSGLGQAIGETHQLYALFHFAFAAFLAAEWLGQNYRGRVYHWLRRPYVSGAISTAAIALLLGLSTFLDAIAAVSPLAALDLALSTANANFLPLLVEGAFGGGIVALILQGAPHLRPARDLAPSPEQRSFSRHLLNAFTRFAVVLTLVLLLVVFNLSINVSTRLVLNQMAHDAQAVSAEIPAFQANLQNLLLQYSENEALWQEDRDTQQKTLQKLFRTSPVYRRVLLVDAEKEIRAFYPMDTTAVALTDLEQTAVANALDSNAPDMTSAQTRATEHILSFVAPVLDEDGRAVAALVGRVPDLSLRNLIVGLQGTVGTGSGFIVDENARIIAHPNSDRLLNFWYPPGDVTLGSPEALQGVNYQGRQGDTNARELVYYISGRDHSWTVVLTVPYEVVLRLALSIAGPLALVLLVIMAGFYVNLAVLGRNLTQPITQLVAASQSIAAGGELNTETMVTAVDREDEIGQLSSAFARMQRTLKRRLDELTLLLNVSHDVSVSIDIQQSMPALLQGMLRGTGAAGARAVVFNPSGGHPLTFGEGPAGKRMAGLDRAIARRLRGQQELMLANKGEIRERLGLAEDTAVPVNALFAIAIRYQERLQGALWLGYRQPHRVSETERNLLYTLAGQASILVENARLFATADGGWRRLAAVLASTTDAVIVTDQTHRVLLINRAMERIFDISANAVMGRPVADVIDVPELVQALTDPSGGSRNQEIPYQDRIYFTNASPIISNDGQALGRVAVLHDITHYKEIDEMKSEFVSTVSHDLRSPLTFMRGYATMLPMAGEINERQQEYVDKILTGIDQMSQMVEDLLDLSRIEAGTEIEDTLIEIRPLLDAIAEEHWQHTHMSGIELQVEVADSTPPIYGDETLIRRAITNLVNNGIKYAPDSGEMLLRARPSNGNVIISVQDNGPGIPKEEQMRLFEKFYRVKQRGTEKVKGSGLGLAIVKSIAEKHGGDAWCESELGQGSTFSISIPMAPSPNGEPA